MSKPTHTAYIVNDAKAISALDTLHTREGWIKTTRKVPEEPKVASLTKETSYRISRRSALIAFGATLAAFPLVERYAGAQTAPSADPLASWNDGTAKQAVQDFVRATTDRSSTEFVAADDRIATFDQDGTLWVEHPLYVQDVFALDRVRELAPQHPEWQNQEPFKSVLSNDPEALAKFTERDWAEIVFLTHAGMSEAEFLELVRQWLKTATHPRFKRLYTDLVYQPMREVMDYLRGNGFKVFIVTGGGQDFVRAYSERIYGLQPGKFDRRLRNAGMDRRGRGCTAEDASAPR